MVRRLCPGLFRLFSTVQISPESIRMGLQSPPRNSAAMRLRIMTMADIPAGMRLKEIAGWNQTAADWKRFLEASPKGCFAAEEDGRICGTATTISFENRFAWVGMVLVDPQYRGRGIGTQLLKRAIEYLDGLKIPAIKLDATPQGKPLYEKLEFVCEYEIERWTLRRPPSAAAKVSGFGARAPLSRNSWNPSSRPDKRIFAETAGFLFSSSPGMRLGSP